MTLTEEQKAAGWLPHDGGPCPVPLDSKPGVMFRNGYLCKEGEHVADIWTMIRDWWQHEGPNHADDIIAYLPEPQP